MVYKRIPIRTALRLADLCVGLGHQFVVSVVDVDKLNQCMELEMSL